jgi:uncharacterized membrane protein YadS
MLSIWWTVKGHSLGEGQATAAVIWERFPKFVLGFMAASLVFSFVLSPALVAETRSALTSMRTIWFALAFTSIV